MLDSLGAGVSAEEAEAAMEVSNGLAVKPGIGVIRLVARCICVFCWFGAVGRVLPSARGARAADTEYTCERRLQACLSAGPPK